jgi:5-oxoprolinase (ATP-hydrolysing)
MHSKGGYPAITDANLVLGRVLPHYFPHIFGPKEDQPLDAAASLAALEALALQVNQHAAAHGLPEKSVDEVLARFLSLPTFLSRSPR